MSDTNSAPEGLDEFLAQPTQGAAPTQQIPGSEPTTPEGLDEFIEPEMKAEKYGTPGQQAITALEGIGTGLAGPLAPMAERAAGVDPKDILARSEANPWTHGLGEVAGVTGSMLAGYGAGAVMEKAGAAVGAKALEALGASAAANLVPKAAPVIAKIGSAAVKGAVENAIFQGSDELSKLVLGDPNQSVETAVVNMGLASVLGGVIGGGVSGAGSLWDAAKGSQTATLLKTITDKMGGIEVVPDAIEDTIAKTGMQLAPEVRSGLSSDPSVQNMFKTLQQTDTTASGRELQKSYTKFRRDAGDVLTESFGKTPKEVESLGDISKYEQGKSIGKTLADEYESQVSPISEQFEKFKDKYKSLELPQDVKLPDGTTAPGIASSVADRVSQRAIDEGWSASPSSDIMKEVNRVIKEIPLQKNLKNLGDYITQVGNNTADFTNPALRRAGGIIKGILKDAEAEVLTSNIGATEGEAAIEAFNGARAAYKAQSDLKDALNDRLHIKSSTGSYAKALREVANTDGESIVSRLSGKGDANLLEFLQKNYPKTADAIRNFHVEELLKTAADKAHPDMNINSEVLLKNFNKLSPELKAFISTPESRVKIESVGKLLEEFNKLPHNHSNTARTLDAMMQHVPGSAVALVAGVLSHSTGVGALVLGLSKFLGKDAPDAIKLGLLKFLGTAKSVDAAGFKAMVENVEHTIKGAELVTKSTKNVFKSEGEALPSSAKPSERDRKSLDKVLKDLRDDPHAVLNNENKAAYYMPDHGQALSRVAAAAVQFLNSQRPEAVRPSPLDRAIEPTLAQKNEYNHTLDLAQQPLLVLNKIKDGSINPKDILTIKTLYPSLYQQLSQKLTAEMTNAVDKNTPIPYATKMGISMFLGQPMDSTMTPTAIMAIKAQAMPIKPVGGQQAPQPKGVPANKLNKIPDMYRTSGQMNSARHASRR